MSTLDEKIDQILSDLDLIKKSLKIVPDKDETVSDFEASISSYEIFARDELKIEQTTVDNHKSAILGFLNHSSGIINKQTVKKYLDSNDSASWKTNQLKALRRYIRDFLKLGRWIEDFEFEKTNAKPKEIPPDQEIVEFFNELPYVVQLVFLVLHNSGLRIGEVLSLKAGNIDFETNMINASEIHTGNTKLSWISFITKQTVEELKKHLAHQNHDQDTKLFDVSERSVQKAFQNTSEWLGITINPHLLRTVFTEKCTKAGIPEKYIDAFCGRIPKSVLAKHYTDYSPASLRKQYDKVEPYLTL